MLNAIKNIGSYIRRDNQEKNEEYIIECLVNIVPSKEIKEILIIDIKDKSIETRIEEFYEKITTKLLFMQEGTFFLGGGI